MYCPNCGKEYCENQNFCRYCGTKLDDIIAQNTLNENIVQNTESTLTENETSVDITVISHKNKINEQQADEKKAEININASNSPQKRINLNKKFAFRKRLVLLVLLIVLFLISIGNLLWSIDVETHISTPTENENIEAEPQINVPTEEQEEERTYAAAPENINVQDESLHASYSVNKETDMFPIIMPSASAIQNKEIEKTEENHFNDETPDFSPIVEENLNIPETSNISGEEEN